MKKDKFDEPVDKAIDTAHKVEQKSAIKEIEAKIVAKKMEFKQLNERERILKSQLEQTQHNIIKTAGVYNALVDLKKTLALKEGYKKENPKLPTPKVPEKKPLSKKQRATIKKNIAKVSPKVMKDIEKASTKTKV